MKFKSRKDPLFTLITFGFVGFFILMSLKILQQENIETTAYWSVAAILLVTGLLLWCFLDTQYELTDTTLLYRCGPIRGTIKIKQINTIVNGKTLWVGLKPATATKGLIIKYDKYNEIYITPDSNESFIKKILSLKSEIVISSS